MSRKVKTISISLSEELEAWLREQSEKCSLSVSAFIRLILVERRGERQKEEI